MKPSFALNLTHDGISLLHRAQAGWLNVGDVSLDAPDLVDELVVLRRTATDLEAAGLSTKLVIPNSQVLYLEVDAPGPTKADRQSQIREALVGVTPYDVRDLNFDWRMKKGKAQVAVVARETLLEAETFATQYRFNPMSFVAMPSPSEFDGEPFFGPTRHAERVLNGGESVEPDKKRIHVLGRLGEVPETPAEPAPEAQPATKPSAEPEAPKAADTMPEPSAVAPKDTAAEVTPQADDDDAAPQQTLPASDDRLLDHVTELFGSLPDGGKADFSEETPSPRRTPEEQSAGDLAAALLSLPDGDGDEPNTSPFSFTSRRARPTARVNGEALPPVAPQPEVKADAAPVAKGPVIDDLPPLPSARSAPVHSPANPAVTRPTTALQDDATAKGDGATADAWDTVLPTSSGGGTAKGDTAAERSANVDPTAPELAPKTDPVLAAALAPGAAATDDAKKPRGSKLAETLMRMGRPKEQKKAEVEDMAAALRQPLPTSAPLKRGPSALPKPLPSGMPPAKPSARGPVPVPPTPPRSGRSSEADAMTVFGARGQTPPRARPKFLGAAIAVALLVVLGVVVLWSTYVMNDVASGWFGLGGDPEIAEVEEPAPVILPEALTTTPPAESDAIVDAAPETTPEPEVRPTPEAAEPSVPLPGIEVTDLQPEPEQAAPVAPSVPDGSEEIAALSTDTQPAPDDAPASAETSGETPELVEEPGPVVDTPDIDMAAVAPPPALSDMPRGPELDDGPAPDIATIAPSQPDGSAEPADDSAAPASGGDAPGTLEIVRLEEPPVAEDAPQAEVSAPAPGRVPAPSQAEADAIYERTGISVLAPPAIESPGIDRLDGTVLSSSDVALADPSPRALPTEDDLTGSDTAPVVGLPPFPLVTEFDLDERGLVRATEEGAISPQGTLVIRGTPPVVPPVRPGTEPPEEETLLDEPAADAQDAELEAEIAALAPDEDDALAGLLSEDDLAEVDERAQFGGLTREELAEVRPSLRPDDAPVSEEVASEETAAEVAAAEEVAQAAEEVVLDVETAADEGPAASDDPAADEAAPDPLIDFADVIPPLRPGTEVASADTTPDGEATDNVQSPSLAAALLEAPDAEAEAEVETAEVETTFDGATELAVDASLTPSTRPAGFASIVQAALDEAAAAPPPPAAEPAQPDPTPVVNAPVRAPEIPTSASVAATATDENALRLNRVNLIGVYGSASNRRALVRLSSGRYVKVQVGDTVDGGRVAAIGDGQLVYTKGGRTITLDMPSG
ncbi:MAG: hypothetical protein CMH12_13600 [Maritimibacter sp.]|nr:hypothetical protein [Maritimibacter sp.]